MRALKQGDKLWCYIKEEELNEAYEIINSMPIMPDIGIWQTLLGA